MVNWSTFVLELLSSKSTRSFLESLTYFLKNLNHLVNISNPKLFVDVLFQFSAVHNVDRDLAELNQEV